MKRRRGKLSSRSSSTSRSYSSSPSRASLPIRRSPLSRSRSKSPKRSPSPARSPLQSQRERSRSPLPQRRERSPLPTPARLTNQRGRDTYFPPVQPPNQMMHLNPHFTPVMHNDHRQQQGHNNYRNNNNNRNGLSKHALRREKGMIYYFAFIVSLCVLYFLTITRETKKI